MLLVVGRSVERYAKDEVHRWKLMPLLTMNKGML